MHTALFSILIFIRTSSGLERENKTYTKVLLSDIKRLDLSDEVWTINKRLQSRIQLRCIADACENIPKKVSCINNGTNNGNIHWKCTADLAQRTYFGKIQVKCEGFDGINDSHVINGSCKLEYYLHYAPKPENTFLLIYMIAIVPMQFLFGIFLAIIVMDESKVSCIDSCKNDCESGGHSSGSEYTDSGWTSSDNGWGGDYGGGGCSDAGYSSSDGFATTTIE